MPVVVVIEDDKLNRAFFETALQSNGFEVSSAGNAEDGLKLIRELSPDAVVMNAGLPGMDGLDATRALKHDPSLAHIPVLVVSSQSSGDFRQRAHEAGGDSFLQKPFGASALREAIHRLLGET